MDMKIFYYEVDWFDETENDPTEWNAHNTGFIAGSDVTNVACRLEEVIFPKGNIRKVVIEYVTDESGYMDMEEMLSFLKDKTKS